MYRNVCAILMVLLFHSAIYAQIKTKQKGVKQLFPITITFQNRVNSQLLSLDSSYINPFGEPFTVRNFRYYISHLSITNNKAKTWHLPQSYFLIDERKPESKSISMQIPFESIGSISFTIGIDSIKNVSGVQTGALDPANGMFWTWNSGYIFAKLEGTSPQSKAPQHGFTYHIGGFRTGENAARKIILNLPQPLPLSPGKPANITIAANINTWFSGSTNIKISALPSIMQPGSQAVQVADNYSRMFSIVP